MSLELNHSFVDVTLLGHAKLMTIKSKLSMSSSDMNWAISLFYLSYVRKWCNGTSKYSNVFFLPVDLWNSKHSRSTLFRSDSLSVIDSDYMGWHHYRHGFCDQCSTTTNCSFYSRKLIQFCLITKHIRIFIEGHGSIWLFYWYYHLFLFVVLQKRTDYEICYFVWCHICCRCFGWHCSTYLWTS